MVQQFETGACSIMQTGVCAPVYEGYGYDESELLYSTMATCKTSKRTPYPKGNPTEPLPPLVMVPGLTNSNINMKLDNARAAGLLGCNTSTHGEYVPLWPVPQSSMQDPKELLCYAYYLGYKFDNKTQTFSPPPGIELALEDFGGVDGLPALAGAVESYQLAGWTLGKDLAGAPYDWRLPVSQQKTSFIKDTKALVERLYTQNSNRKVVIMGVSFGPQNALGFLHAMTQQWKDTYVDWFIALSPVWSGSVLMLQSYISGPAFGHHGGGGGGGGGNSMSELYLALFHSTPFGGWTFPRASGAGSDGHTDTNYTWGEGDTLLSTPAMNYSAHDYQRLFKDLGYTTPQKEVLNFCLKDDDLFGFKSPGVNTFVAYGYGVPTAANATYDEDFHRFKVPPQPNSTVSCSGDSLVPLRSSKRGYVWADEMRGLNKTLVIRGYEGQRHAECLTTQPSDPNPCFMDWFAWITNHTGPPSDAEDLVQEGPCYSSGPYQAATAQTMRQLMG